MLLTIIDFFKQFKKFSKKNNVQKVRRFNPQIKRFKNKLFKKKILILLKIKNKLNKIINKNLINKS